MVREESGMGNRDGTGGVAWEEDVLHLARNVKHLAFILCIKCQAILTCTAAILHGEGLAFPDEIFTRHCILLRFTCFLHFDSEMVRVLVAHGASIGLRGGSDSWTPLMYAAMAGALYPPPGVCMYVCEGIDSWTQRSN